MSEEVQYVTATSFEHLKEGDTITRMLAGTIPMKMKVEKVDEDYIHMAGGWTFERSTGFEYDPDIGSGSKFNFVASYLVK